MHIICLTPLEEEIYNDRASDTITTPPEGWAVIPEGFELPATFPRLGSLVAEEKTYTREVEVEKEVTKTRAVPVMGADGELITAEEEFTERERTTELREYTMMTVTEMTESVFPEIAEIVMPATQLDKVEAQSTYTAMMTDTLLIEEVATLELHSPWYDKILLWYQQNLWTITMLKEAVEKNLIAQDEADEIINSK